MSVGLAVGADVSASGIRRIAARADRALLDRARLRVLRATVLICLMITCGDLVGAIAGFTASGEVVGPSIGLAAAWCWVWLVAAIFVRITSRCFKRWRLTLVVLWLANLATTGLTGGITSPDLAVCMYVGWIASVVVPARQALVISAAMTLSIFVGYIVAGASVADIVTGQYRYAAVSNALGSVIAGVTGTLLTSVTNSIFGRLAQTLDDLRAGAEATSPALTALFAKRPMLFPMAPSQVALCDCPQVGLTNAERDVVAMLADGQRPKQIARLRGVALSTVRSQIKAAKAKSGARTINELIALTWTTQT